MGRIMVLGATAAVLSVLVGGGVVLRRGTHASRPVLRAVLPATRQQGSTELAQLHAEIAALRAQVRALQRAVENPASIGPTQPCQSAHSAEEAAPATAHATTSSDTSELAQRFAEVHARDTADRASTMRYEAEVMDFFDAHGPENVVLEDVACGAKLCRIRVEHASEEARQWFADALGDERLASGSFVQPTEDGLASVAYVGRRGAEFRVPIAP